MIRAALLAAACLAASPALTACDPQPAPRRSASSAVAPAPDLRRVVRIYDGDTITTREDGSVRLLGYDAPELGSRARCPREDQLARAARDHLAARLAGGVELRTAVDDRGRRQADKDRYGRLLRAAFAADGGDMAAELIGQGLAVPYWGRGARKDWCAPGAGP